MGNVSDCESSDQDYHSDESSGACVRGMETDEVPENPSRKQIDIDRAIDFMRFVFKERLAFEDNGSGRSLLERTFEDMGSFMVNMQFEQPGDPQRDGPRRSRMLTRPNDSDFARVFAKETRKSIGKEIQGDFFGIFVDVWRPRTTWINYMLLFVRYVNDDGEAEERLLGVVPEPDVSGPSLNEAVQSMLSEAGLSMSKVRGQGYGLLGYDDEVICELRTLVTSGHASAYCVHPHVCQVHSTLVSASMEQFEVYELLKNVDVLSDLIGECRQFTEKLCTLIKDSGVNLEDDLRKPGETNWGSYYEAILKFAGHFSSVSDALDFVEEEVTGGDAKYKAWKVDRGSYDFAFGLLLMQDVLGATHELSLAFDREGMDGENYVALLQEAKKQLQVMRDEGWMPFLNRVGMFCNEHDLYMPTMGEKFEPPRWKRDKEAKSKTKLEHYHVDFFQKVINDQLNALDKRFSSGSSESFLLASCLNPRNSFQAFDKDKLVKFTPFYPSEFGDSDIIALDLQLRTFISDVRSDVRFRGMDMLSDLSTMMVDTGKNNSYPLVYLLLKLALILPGTPATATSASSAMKFIDSTMTKEPCNQWISDCLLLYLERDIFETITNDAVVASL